jgi:hypothetical protein
MNKFIYQIAYYPSSRAVKPIRLIYYLHHIDVVQSFDLYNYCKGEMRITLIPTIEESNEYKMAVRNSTHAQIVRAFTESEHLPL